MTQFNKMSYYILLGHMLKTPAVRAAAMKHVQAGFFQHPDVAYTEVRPVHGLIFDVIVKYTEKYATAPDIAALTQEVTGLAQRYGNPSDPVFVELFNELNSLAQFSTIVEPASIPVAMELIQFLVDTCYFDEQQRAIAQEAMESREIGALASRLSQLSAERQAMLGGATKTGVSQMQFEDTGGRLFTGVGFLDSRLGQGKGPISAGMTTLIAPQNGGKTTLGIQLCVNQSLLHKPSLLVLIEEGMTPHVRRNIMACATGIPTTLLETANDVIADAAKLAGIELEPARAKLDLIDRYLHVMDMAEHPGGPDAVMNEIERLAMGGQKPTLGYIDWAGQWAQYIIANPPAGRKLEKDHDALKYLSSEVAQGAKRLKTSLWLSHQMAPDKVLKGPFADNDQYCGAGCKSLSEPANYCVVLNKKDPRTELQLANIAKARQDKNNQKIIVRLRGELCCFEEATGWAKQGNSFQNKEAKPATNTLPTEQKAKRNNTETER